MSSTPRIFATVAAGAALAFPGAALADPTPTYPPVTVTVCPPNSACFVLTPTQAAAAITGLPADKIVSGKTFTITLAGYAPGTMVTVVIHSAAVTLGTFPADSAGVVHATVSVPQGFDPGAHSITLSGLGRDGKLRTSVIPVQVLSKPGAGSAATGGSGGNSSGDDHTALLAVLGVVVLGGGAAAVVILRRRRSAPLHV